MYCKEIKEIASKIKLITIEIIYCCFGVEICLIAFYLTIFFYYKSGNKNTENILVSNL